MSPTKILIQNLSKLIKYDKHFDIILGMKLSDQNSDIRDDHLTSWTFCPSPFCASLKRNDERGKGTFFVVLENDETGRYDF